MGFASCCNRNYKSTRLVRRFRETNGYVTSLSIYNSPRTWTISSLICSATVVFLCLAEMSSSLPILSSSVSFLRHRSVGTWRTWPIRSDVSVRLHDSSLLVLCLLFLDRLSTCASLLHTAPMLFNMMMMMMMKFDVNELQGAVAFLGPFCFTVFVLVVICVCMSMIVTIIDKHFRATHQRVEREVNQEHQTLVYIWPLLGVAVGWRTATKDEAQTPSTYRHAAESLLEIGEQFLVTFDRVSSLVLSRFVSSRLRSFV